MGGLSTGLFWDFPDITKALNFKPFGNLWGNSYISCLLQIITLHFTYGERKIWSNIKILKNIFFMQSFSFLFMSLLTAQIIKNSHILAGFYFIFLKNTLDQFWRLLIPNADLNEKIGQVIIKKNQILAIFAN